MSQRARAARVAAQVGMGFRVVVGTSLVVLLLCGVSLVAPTASGPSGERPARDVGGLEEELRVGVAELAAVLAESRALFAKVLGRLEGLAELSLAELS